MVLNDNVKILVVEDDREDFVLLKDTLQKDGPHEFNLTHAGDLKVAFEKLDENDFDLILLDLALPDSKGLDTVAKINSKRPKTPVVVLTGVDDREVGLGSVRKGAQDFLVKGKVTYDNFSKAIYYSLERARLEYFRDEIVNNISHELRTPLTIIRESISQVVDGIFGEINEKQDKYLQKSLTNIDRLRGIIDNLLDISKLEEGKLELFKEKTDIAVLIEEVVSSFSLKAQTKNIEIKSSLINGKLEALVDRDKIIQVFINLVGNALKFTEKGYIELSAVENEQHIECRVKDTGLGIAQKDLSRLFSKFDQIGRQSGPGEKGTGLGLTITKGIVELHGGSISVESKEGEGTMFMFTLPKYDLKETSSEGLKSLITKSINQFSQFSLIRFGIQNSKELTNQLGEPVLDEFLYKLQHSISKRLYRKLDEVTRSSNAIYILLPDTEKENSVFVVDRIQKNINEIDWLKEIGFKSTKDQLKLDLNIKVISFPRDGLTGDELILKLESLEGSVI